MTQKTASSTKNNKLPEYSSQDILTALQQWRDESEVVDAKGLLRALRKFRNGDFSARLPENQIGVAGEISRAFNESIEMNQILMKEFERVGKLVSRDGRLDQRVSVSGARGGWAKMTETYNASLQGITGPVVEFGHVVEAVARGDLNVPMPLSIDGLPLRGELSQVAKTTNQMIKLLSNFAAEVTRVSTEVGTEGKLGGSAKTRGAAGVWLDITNSVNGMADNLTNQVRGIATVTTAVANGDLSKRITVDAQGEVLELKNTVNEMVERLTQFSAEVTRVASEVGTDGKLGGKAIVPEVAGVWRDLTNNVNGMADNLTNQVRNIATVATAVANGDLSQRITVDALGEVLELKTTINSMVDRLNLFASEVTRVAREVGTEGQLGGKALVDQVSGVWQDLTNNVNSMADNLTGQVRNISTVAAAIANGDLSQKITVDAQGEMLDLKNTINTMIDGLNQFSSEVTRVAREVGTEGKLGGTAEVEQVSGVWQDLTTNVNDMATNLTNQVRNIATVATAVADGDLTRKITVDAKGEVLELKNTINTMVDSLTQFSVEVTRVAREVGTEGKLGGKADVRDVGGVWQELTNNVNGMADNLTGQVRNIAAVATAVANGDLTQSITVDAQGEMLELKDTINTMVRSLNQFSAEVTRVAQEVGTDGVLGGRADVQGVEGVWRALTDSVNGMADNLTLQVRNIAAVATAVANGDLNQKITVNAKGEILELKDTINTMVDQLNVFSAEVTRVAQEVGTDGILGGKANVRGVSGAWEDLTNNVNNMAENLTNQVRNIAAVTTAVAKGDLKQKITVDAKGEVQELKNTINSMVDQLNTFSAEVTRVAQEVGTLGLLGSQAEVSGVSGAWADLTRNVNVLANNLTSQVRDISRVATAVANGDLAQKIQVDAQGEVLDLKNTINSMTGTLSTFANQVTTVAKEVGTEGLLGGQAEVPDASGIWKDLTGNVNELADNLTRQIRAILEVVTDVTEGTLTGSIDVVAKGEVETLRNGLNQMIRTLRETSDVNNNQDWLKTNLSNLGQLMQGNRTLQDLGEVVIQELCPIVGARSGAFYALDALGEHDAQGKTLSLLASYAFNQRKALANKFEIGQGLVGQAAREKKLILVNDVPEDYIKVGSGLGEAKPLSLIVLPVVFQNDLIGVFELATFQNFTDIEVGFLEQLVTSFGVVANAVIASSQTEDLLRKSQSLSTDLQEQQDELQESNAKMESQTKVLRESEARLKTQQEELQRTNEELEETSRTYAEQKRQVEIKNHEVEEAREQIEEKAKQLAISSKYKSEFLANMSHELRTPLNSLMVLSDGLRKNQEKNLTPKQVEKMSTIHESGTELLELINEILDLARIESGKMTIHVGDIFVERLKDWADRGFQQLAENKGLDFDVTLGETLPASIQTDEKRLQQVIKNFVSNALKFTEDGSVNLDISLATAGWSEGVRSLDQADAVVAIAVKDTGIGIPQDKQGLVFEAFQQADGTTSRRYGGTGLGLSISREISVILGGEITLHSTPGKGSVFTLFLPLEYPNEIELPGDTDTDFLTPTMPAGQYVESKPAEVDDDRTQINPGDRAVLIIEDDVSFAKLLLERAREKGFKGIVATRGDTGLFCAQEYRLDAVILDINLPMMNGWTVLDRIKHDPTTRHLPVHVVSVDDVARRGLRQGAISCLQKPLDDARLQGIFDDITEFKDLKVRQLLVVEDDSKQRQAIIELIGNGDVHVTAVASAEEALVALEKRQFHCMVLDLMLPDMNGLELIEKIKQEPGLNNLPIIVYTGKEISKEEENRLKQAAETIIVKNVKSPERLLDETALFLHRVEANLPESKRQMLQQVHEHDPQLAGRKILIVDDDVRNIFTLTSVFEAHDSITMYAESGLQAIETLKKNPDIELILMDIMMPEMDGYEAMTRIRAIKAFKSLPIIAVTAKAMKEDRQKCLDAGASDYIVKPVDTEQLLSLVRVWLYKETS